MTTLAQRFFSNTTDNRESLVGSPGEVEAAAAIIEALRVAVDRLNGEYVAARLAVHPGMEYLALSAEEGADLASLMAARLEEWIWSHHRANWWCAQAARRGGVDGVAAYIAAHIR